MSSLTDAMKRVRAEIAARDGFVALLDMLGDDLDLEKRIAALTAQKTALQAEYDGMATAVAKTNDEIAAMMEKAKADADEALSVATGKGVDLLQQAQANADGMWAAVKEARAKVDAETAALAADRAKLEADRQAVLAEAQQQADALIADAKAAMAATAAETDAARAELAGVQAEVAKGRDDLAAIEAELRAIRSRIPE